MKIAVLDCETTGTDHEKDRVVEVGLSVLEETKKGWLLTGRSSWLVDPGMPIPPQAMAVHHILDKDVKGKKKFAEVMGLVKGSLGDFIPVAHFAEFDSKFLPLGEDWICTYRCARHVWPDEPSHSNQALRYSLRLFKEPDESCMPPHRAGPDTYVTAHIVLRLLKDHTPARLVEMTKAPILLKTVGFGKHRGEEWARVPKDYLRWLIGQGDFDRDVVHTAKHYFGKRG